MNGIWFSQGTLYLADAGEVVLVHKDSGLIGATWPDFSTFLQDEISRKLAARTPDGDLLPGHEALPQFTQSWEMVSRRFTEERRNLPDPQPDADDEEGLP